MKMNEFERMGEARTGSAVAGRDESAVERPNFAFSPPLVAHFPAPLESRRTRKPM